MQDIRATGPLSQKSRIVFKNPGSSHLFILQFLWGLHRQADGKRTPHALWQLHVQRPDLMRTQKTRDCPLLWLPQRQRHFLQKSPQTHFLFSILARIELPAGSWANHWHRVRLHLHQSSPPQSWGWTQVLHKLEVISWKDLVSIRRKQERRDAEQRTAMSTTCISLEKKLSI